jgi:hypothetical protein
MPHIVPTLLVLLAAAVLYTSAQVAPLQYGVKFALYNMNTTDYCNRDCTISPNCPINCVSNATSNQLYTLTNSGNGYITTPSLSSTLSAGGAGFLCFVRNFTGFVNNQVYCTSNPSFAWMQFIKVGGQISPYFYSGDLVQIWGKQTTIGFNGAYCGGQILTCDIPTNATADVFQVIFAQ